MAYLSQARVLYISIKISPSKIFYPIHLINIEKVATPKNSQTAMVKLQKKSSISKSDELKEIGDNRPSSREHEMLLDHKEKTMLVSDFNGLVLKYPRRALENKEQGEVMLKVQFHNDDVHVEEISLINKGNIYLSMSAQKQVQDYFRTFRHKYYELGYRKFTILCSFKLK